jgi:hypothetical protein
MDSMVCVGAGPLLDDMQQDDAEVSESARARRKFRLPMKLMMVEEKRMLTLF